jgi:predicted RNA-binding Zn ribbon-like protein
VWQESHFIGGHPVLDLTNTVFSRAHPTEDGELLKTPSDVLTWCAAAGLSEETPPVVAASAAGFVPQVHAVREQAWAVFSAVARGQAVPPEPFGALAERAGTGMRAGHVQQIDAALDRVTADWKEPEAIPAFLSLLAVHALFVLQPDRIRECGRCGWLFLDSSRGGGRRWCSMSICGNREKAARHRQSGRAAG